MNKQLSYALLICMTLSQGLFASDNKEKNTLNKTFQKQYALAISFANADILQGKTTRRKEKQRIDTLIKQDPGQFALIASTAGPVDVAHYGLLQSRMIIAELLVDLQKLTAERDALKQDKSTKL